MRLLSPRLRMPRVPGALASRLARLFAALKGWVMASRLIGGLFTIVIDRTLLWLTFGAGGDWFHHERICLHAGRAARRTIIFVCQT